MHIYELIVNNVNFFANRKIMLLYKCKTFN